MLASRLAIAVVLSAGAVGPLLAQDSSCVCLRPGRKPSELALRSSGTVTFIQSRPLGGLAENIGLGYGVNGSYLLRLDHSGAMSLRVDGGVVQYGSESMRVPLSSTVGGRIQVKVST